MHTQCKNQKIPLWRMLLPSLVLMLTGCGSIVYKDAATTYTVAGRAATKALGDAATTLAAAQDRLKATRVVSDPMCPIGEQRIFLRENEASRVFQAAITQIGMDVTEDCNRLSSCLTRPADIGCSNTCYSAEEANCIASIEVKSAQALKSMSSDQADQFARAIQPLAASLNRVEYGRATPIQNALVKASLDGLTDYLDLLDKVVKNRESDVSDHAKKLSGKLTATRDKLLELSSTTLSTTDKENQTKIANSLTALGKLIDDIKVIAKNAQDASAIRKAVSENSTNVEILTENVKEIAIGDSWLGSAYKNLAQLQVRQDLQSRYMNAKDAYERWQLLAERDKLAYSDGGQVKNSVGALFDAMKNSHRALVQLVVNPSDEELKAIANERFQEFKSIAEDIASFVQLVS